MNPHGLEKKNSSPNKEILTIFYVALDAILINDLTIALLRSSKKIHRDQRAVQLGGPIRQLIGIAPLLQVRNILSFDLNMCKY